MNATPKTLLDIDDVAALFGCSRSHIRRAWYSSAIPAPIRLGRRSIRWRADDLAKFVESQTPVTPEGKTE